MYSADHGSVVKSSTILSLLKSRYFECISVKAVQQWAYELLCGHLHICIYIAICATMFSGCTWCNETVFKYGLMLTTTSETFKCLF